MVTLTLEDRRKTIATGVLFLAAVLYAGINVHAAWSDASGLARSDNRGPVMVTATYVPPAKATDEIRFTVRLNTHSVNLDQYRLGDQAAIRFDEGKEHKSLGATRQGSGHHVMETLRFAGPVPKGARKMALIIRDLGGVPERTLQWKLPVE